MYQEDMRLYSHLELQYHAQLLHIQINLEIDKASTAILKFQIDGLVQERHNSSALAMELRLSSTNPSIWYE